MLRKQADPPTVNVTLYSTSLWTSVTLTGKRQIIDKGSTTTMTTTTTTTATTTGWGTEF